MSGHWHNSKNRGFYYGTSDPWVNDLCWKRHVDREIQQYSKALATKQLPPLRLDCSSASSRSSRVTRSLGSNDVLPRTPASISSDISLRKLEGLRGHDKVSFLCKELKRERDQRKRKEHEFVQILAEERVSRVVVDERMRLMESRLHDVVSRLGTPPVPTHNYLPRTTVRV
eukprot:CAMPEP_0114545640 /NCGR_PEP_ID=MMETSP0114-20121206/3516_1 /TAXON_ID=31324 /ORGANISM="Goniomonas sp, Strain m" /LENGTH=170 /DNA_ID=CAMNT_0001730097 /DNA_START=67 /DNA_END=579 /DNA_ORIENTATION=-